MNKKKPCVGSISNFVDCDYLVSIVIPVFNVIQYIANSLDSVINQTFSNLEIIIIDDGSTDGSGKICDEFAKIDDRIRVIHQENKGLSNARNIGLDMMSGDVVAFLDPDDLYDPNYVMAMINAMIIEEADLVICRYKVKKKIAGFEYTDKKTYPPINSGIFDRNSTLCSLVEGTINTNVWNKLYKKKLWETIRFPEGHVFEDGEVAYRIINLCQRICVIDSPLYIYNKHAGSITTSLSLNSLNDQILATVKIESFIRNNIPNVFSMHHLKMHMKSRLNQMMIFYIKLPTIRKCDKEVEANCEMLRKEIEDIGIEIGIKDCGIRIRCAYWMILNSPWILRIIYPLYLPIRIVSLSFKR